ncbi:MAG: S9 family peptidase, partial [Thermoanaerobaculaceae bacterium]|nr:S9 family peptidase [Thermoanaerobaculaceae bacterium]
MRLLALALATALAAPGAVALPTPSPAPTPTKRPLSLDDLLRVRTVSDPRISPDGEWVAYVVKAYDLERDEQSSDIWMSSWDGARHVHLTVSPEDDTSPRWSPDGRFIAFLSARGDDGEEAETQVWLLGTAGGEATQVTRMEGGVEDYAWSPDSQRLVLVAKDPDPEKVEREKAGSKKKPPRPIVVDRYQFKEDYVGYLDNRRSHLVLFDLATRKAEPLTAGAFDDALPAFSPDGSRIAFASKRGGDPDRHWNWDVYVIDAKPGATPCALTGFPGTDGGPDWDSAPEWSPDGRWIAYLRAGGASIIDAMYGGPELAVVSAEGGEPRRLTAALDRHVRAPHWAPDGRSLLVLVEDERRVAVARVAAEGGDVARLTTRPQVALMLDVGRNGRVAAVVSQSTAPGEVFAVEPDGALRPLSFQNAALLAALDLGPVEEMDFTSRDGTRIGAMVTKPRDFAPGHRYPMVVWIHGGPVGQDQHELDRNALWAQAFAARGFVVVRPNYRGSSGRGLAFSKAIAGAWGTLEVQDVLAAVDGLVARGIADPQRLVIGGWSYGGITTNYTIARDQRFKAAISGAGSSLQLSMYGVDQYIYQYETELGRPWENPEAWMKVSYPFFQADKITTPTLFMVGEKDFNVPAVGSEQMYQALKSQGKETQLVIYPGQYHG